MWFKSTQNLTVTKPSALSTFLGYGFLFFAFLLWIVAIPVLSGMLEPNIVRKKWMRYLFWLGCGGAAYLLYFMVTSPLTVCVTNHSIDYQIFVPFIDYFFIVYVLATCGSLLISSIKNIRLFGWLIFFSLLITIWAYRETLTSVWCFFSAILSCLVFLEVARDTKINKFFQQSKDVVLKRIKKYENKKNP